MGKRKRDKDLDGFEKIQQNLGSVIREERKRSRLTQEDLSKKTGLTRECICMYETGKRMHSIATLEKISLGLGLKLSELFRRVEKRK